MFVLQEKGSRGKAVTAGRSGGVSRWFVLKAGWAIWALQVSQRWIQEGARRTDGEFPTSHRLVCSQDFWSGVAGMAVSYAPATRIGELCATRLTRAGGFRRLVRFVTCALMFSRRRSIWTGCLAGHLRQRDARMPSELASIIITYRPVKGPAANLT